jgi:hypothetical protein
LNRIRLTGASHARTGYSGTSHVGLGHAGSTESKKKDQRRRHEEHHRRREEAVATTESGWEDSIQTGKESFEKVRCKGGIECFLQGGDKVAPVGKVHEDGHGEAAPSVTAADV